MAVSVSGPPRAGPSRLEVIRRYRGHTLARLARLVKFNAASLSQIENSLSVPSLVLVDRLAKALDVPPALLFPTIAGGNDD